MKKISKVEYYNLFCQWRESGLSKAGFAAREGISKISFYYWSRKFEGENDPAQIPSGFSRILPDPNSQKDPVIRINYPSGVSVEFFGQIDLDSVKRLL